MAAKIPATSSSIKFSDIANVMGGSTSSNIKMSNYTNSSSTYYAKGVPGISDTSVNVGSFAEKSKALLPGLQFRVFGNSGTTAGYYFADDTTWFDKRTENYNGLASNFSDINTSTNGLVPNNSSWENYSVEWFGYFYASVTGTYTFWLDSDDASYMWLGPYALVTYVASTCLINNGGGHGMTLRSATINLSANTYYPIRMMFGEAGGGDNFICSFSAPGISRIYDLTGYVFFGLGTDINYPAPSASLILAAVSSNSAYNYITLSDDVYYINVIGTSTQTYCIMDKSVDGGGWMMALKANRTTTFQYSSSHWTTPSTLNTDSLNGLIGEAKFNVMNFCPAIDMLAVWPDITTNGGSLPSNKFNCWTWLEKNITSTPGTVSTNRTTLIYLFSTASRKFIKDAKTFSGWNGTIFSSQSDVRFYGFNYYNNQGDSNGTRTRWGFGWNENGGGLYPNGDMNSDDVAGGIGMNGLQQNTGLKYSAGDAIGCCQDNTGINRSARVQIYIR